MSAPAEERAGESGLTGIELRDAWPVLSTQERLEGLSLLTHAETEALFLGMHAHDQADLLLAAPLSTRRSLISYLRRQTRQHVESVYYLYVLDAEQHLLGVVSFRDLFSAQPDKRVRDVMSTDVHTVPEDMDQEAVSKLFAQHNYLAMPVVDAEGRVKGIVTVDDIVDVVQEEATEDIQKLGGMEALDAPYLSIGFGAMLRKRAGWLSVLFISEMLTASAMAVFEKEIARAVILALFVPLIISSGGNSGSQASTLVVRALALGEVKLRDWWRVIRREFMAGLSLGLILATLGFVRILAWQSVFHLYGEHYFLIACTVAGRLIGVVMFGTLAW